jgi:hypothetical protein
MILRQSDWPNKDAVIIIARDYLMIGTRSRQGVACAAGRNWDSKEHGLGAPGARNCSVAKPVVFGAEPSLLLLAGAIGSGAEGVAWFALPPGGPAGAGSVLLGLLAVRFRRAIPSVHGGTRPVHIRVS